MDGLALGAFIALAARETGGLLRLAGRLHVIAVSSAVLLAALFIVRGGLKHYDPVVSTFGFTLFALMFAGTLTRVLTEQRESIVVRLFVHRVLRSLGKVQLCVVRLSPPHHLLARPEAAAQFRANGCRI